VPASGKGVQLSWTAPANTGGSAITSYKVYRGTSSSGSFAFIASVGGSTTSYKDTSTVRGATYYYEVTAVNSAGESPPSKAGPVQAK
jgi:fibronectin type 3 domain-containing protein